jgi:hypothetical protein
MALPDVDAATLRARLDADPSWVTDAQLDAALDVARELVGNEVGQDGDYSTSPAVREAIYQIAVKVYDLGTRGVQNVDLDGSPDPPAMPATAGLIRTVRGLLLPAMPTGGLTA